MQRARGCNGACLQVWTAAQDGKIYVYSDDGAGALTYLQALATESMRTGVRALALSGDRVFSGSEDGHVACWNAATCTALASAGAHSNIVSSLCSVGDLVRGQAPALRLSSQ